jgi:prevent-host-death family protein
MKLDESIRPISYVKTHAAEMLKRVNDSRNPIVITQNGHAKGVLLDTASYQEMVDTIGLLKLVAQAEREIDDGKTVSHDEAIANAMKAIHSQ